MMSRSPDALSGALQRRILPLALLAGVLVGGVLPAIYQHQALSERAAEAQLWARQVATRYEGLAPMLADMLSVTASD